MIGKYKDTLRNIVLYCRKVYDVPILKEYFEVFDVCD